MKPDIYTTSWIFILVCFDFAVVGPIRLSQCNNIFKFIILMNNIFKIYIFNYCY